jgi:hypothetical protein
MPSYPILEKLSAGRPAPVVRFVEQNDENPLKKL